MVTCTSLLDFPITLKPQRPAPSAASSPGKSDAVRLRLQVQMTTGILHSLFNATEAVTRLIKGAWVPFFLSNWWLGLKICSVTQTCVFEGQLLSKSFFPPPKKLTKSLFQDKILSCAKFNYHFILTNDSATGSICCRVTWQEKEKHGEFIIRHCCTVLNIQHVQHATCAPVNLCLKCNLSHVESEPVCLVLQCCLTRPTKSV